MAIDSENGWRWLTKMVGIGTWQPEGRCRALLYAQEGCEVFSITPVITGAGGFGTILLGAALIGLLRSQTLLLASLRGIGFGAGAGWR